MNELRNSVAHGRFQELKYEGHALSDLKGQMKIIVDFMNVCKKDRQPEVIAQDAKTTNKAV
ncbi:MAG: hypothetical protein WC845_01625 [Candidatus Staskawiczbacteria bacterium]|jgi:hypothetical protein